MELNKTSTSKRITTEFKKIKMFMCRSLPLKCHVFFQSTHLIVYLDCIAGLLGDALQGDDDLEGGGQDVPRGHVVEDALVVDLVRYCNRPENLK